MIFRVEKNKNYTTISNYHLRDKRLSLKAKGLLSWMLSNNDDWDYSIKGIVASCKESETAIKSTLNELKRFHYLEIKKCAADNIISTFHYEYIIYEKPTDAGIDSPAMENPPLEDPAMENPLQINIKKRNTKEINTKSNKRDNPETFKDLYNEHCYNLPKVRQLSDKRIKAIRIITSKYSREDILEVLDKANDSDFLTGNNDRGWTADIDFILREDKFLNILEGKYGGKKKKKSNDGLVLAPRATKEDRDEYKYRF